MQIILAVFPKFDDAKEAVRYMLTENVEESDINAVTQDWVFKSHTDADLGAINVEITQMPPGLERILGGEQPIDLPDTGSVYAAGKKATVLAKNATDSGSGFKVTLQEFGVPEKAAEGIQEAIRNGGVLLWVAVDEAKAPTVGDIFKLNNAHHITTPAG